MIADAHERYSVGDIRRRHTQSVHLFKNPQFIHLVFQIVRRDFFQPTAKLRRQLISFRRGVKRPRVKQFIQENGVARNVGEYP